MPYLSIDIVGIDGYFLHLNQRVRNKQPKPKQKNKMKLTRISSAALALAITAILGTSAHAAPPTYNPGDVIIGFQQTNSSNDYEVDLGSASRFLGATSNLTFNLSVTDLNSTFTSNWASNSATNLVQWGVIGASNKAVSGDLVLGSWTLPANTLFYTKGELTPGTLTTAPAEKSSSLQGNINNNIAIFDGQFAAPTSAQTAGSTASLQAIDLAAGSSGSFDKENATSNFGIASGNAGSILQNSLSAFDGPTNSVLDLYELTPTNADVTKPTTLLGEFSLSSGGVLTFDAANVAAVPEPSTYALMGVGALLLVWRLRRKTASIL